jgi:hypothetical protein
MPDIDLKTYLDRLRKALPYVPPIPIAKIKALHKKGDLGGVVRLIRDTMKVNVHLALHWTSEQSPTNPNALTSRLCFLVLATSIGLAF